MIMHVVGARPNFMKLAPVHTACANRGIPQKIVHTGQHYDANMSEIFFGQLGMPKPDINLGIGSGSHAVQTAQIMMCFEKVLHEHQPDLVLVYGDVNSTVAAALVCAKLGVRVGHVEAGLRSFDRSMPEEINRLLTDQIADLLFTPSLDGNENLLREGIAEKKIHFVGNVMIDTLVRMLPNAMKRWQGGGMKIADTYVKPGCYTLLTLHRPSNVDDKEILRTIIDTMSEVSKEIPTIFPIHPRTRQLINNLQITTGNTKLFLTEPLGYLDFLALQRYATMVITDSGGIQEETTYLGVPCLTVRENTERPVTVTSGTNILIGQNMGLLIQEANSILIGKGKQGSIPPLWDGQAAERIAEIISR
jgi:UDP-N-acetylglucosamine 2-epimerase (non-hydrolysing)